MIRSQTPDTGELSSTEDEDCTTSTTCKNSSKHQMALRRAKVIRSVSRDPEELSESSTDNEEHPPDKNTNARQSSAKHATSRRAKTTRLLRREVVDIASSESSAEDEEESPVASGSPATSVSGSPQLECPICLQNCSHPARLPCCHIYCFLCLKGIFHQDRRCAMCRQPIPPDYMKRPDLLEVPTTVNESKHADDKYEWFYEGKNGWWKFEERLSQDLEEAHLQGLDSLETLICGSLYTIDLKDLVQYNKDCPARKRHIKRELAVNVVVKGVAGIR